jgi:hypothetical protein
MATSRRASTGADGQRSASPTLRHRDLSGVRIGGPKALRFLRYYEQLEQLIVSVGAPCWATDVTCAALMGFDGYELKPPFHLMVPRTRAPRPLGHIVHRGRDIDALDTTWAMGLPCLSATRTLIELARVESPKRLTVALDSALRDGLTSEDFLHRRIVALRRRGRTGLDKLLAVMEGSERTRGGHSYLERSFLEFIAEVGLPHPSTQQVLAKRGKRLVRVDFRFPDTNVVVEVLGYRFHRSRMEMQIDSERVNALQLAGFLVLQFTYVDVVSRAPSMRADLIEALGLRR